MKKCPYCAEEIQDEAIICHYCRSDLSQAEKIQEKNVPPQIENQKPSIWKSGAKTSAIITVIYAISKLFQPMEKYELLGSLTIGLVSTFFFWWLISASMSWVWRKLRNSVFGVIVFIALIIFLFFALISLGSY